MGFKLLHIFSHKNHNYNQPHLHVKLVQREFVGPLCSLSTTDQTRNMVLKQKSFLCSSFNPFYALKCVLGAGENELESVQCPAILSEAITEDPQRHGKKLKQTERSVLCEIVSPPLDPFYFYCFCGYFACFPSPRLCLPLLSSLSFYSLYHLSIFSISSPIFCHPPLFSSDLESPARFGLYPISLWSGTVYRKWKMHFNFNNILKTAAEACNLPSVVCMNDLPQMGNGSDLGRQTLNVEL